MNRSLHFEHLINNNQRAFRVCIYIRSVQVRDRADFDHIQTGAQSQIFSPNFPNIRKIKIEIFENKD